MPTVKEILKASGFTDEKIAEMDAAAMTAFGNVLTEAQTERTSATAAQAKADADFKAATEAVAKAEKERKDAIAAREEAQLAQRSNVEFYEQKIVPGLTSWEEEKTRLENERVQALSQAAFYKTQNDGAKSSGFIPADAPGYVPPATNEPKRDANGQYVAGGGGTPGSPTFVDPKDIYKRAGDGMTMLTDINWRHQQLYGTPLPIAPSQLIAEADAQKLDPKAYAEKRFSFAQREQELAAQRQAERDTKLQADATAAANAAADERMKTREAEFAVKEKQLSERAGNNPDVRTPAGSSKYAEIKRAVETGERPNPLKMTDAQRRAATQKAIHSEIEAREGAVA